MKGNVFFGLVHLTWEDNPFGREVKFTSKYIIVGGGGGIRDLFKGATLFFWKLRARLRTLFNGTDHFRI